MTELSELPSYLLISVSFVTLGALGLALRAFSRSERMLRETYPYQQEAKGHHYDAGYNLTADADGGWVPADYYEIR